MGTKWKIIYLMAIISLISISPAYAGKDDAGCSKGKAKKCGVVDPQPEPDPSPNPDPDPEPEPEPEPPQAGLTLETMPPASLREARNGVWFPDQDYEKVMGYHYGGYAKFINNTDQDITNAFLVHSSLSMSGMHCGGVRGGLPTIPAGGSWPSESFYGLVVSAGYPCIQEAFIELETCLYIGGEIGGDNGEKVDCKRQLVDMSNPEVYYIRLPVVTVEQDLSGRIIEDRNGDSYPWLDPEAVVAYHISKGVRYTNNTYEDITKDDQISIRTTGTTMEGQFCGGSGLLNIEIAKRSSWPAAEGDFYRSWLSVGSGCLTAKQIIVKTCAYKGGDNNNYGEELHCESEILDMIPTEIR